MSEQCALVAKKANGILAASGGCCQQVKGGDPAPLLSSGEAAPGPAPYWEGTAVINGEFKELKLTDYEGKYLVFFFYPLDFTFVCPTEIIAFSDRIEEFRAINTEVVACSVDSKFTHLAWINTPRKQGGLGPMKIPLLWKDRARCCCLSSSNPTPLKC
uniref:thioredoxin-dependent peroxiredoxin n=1 Tax=Nothoprocta perdicaria TaxID=30464 RepID=A0A8C6YP06_NOTPE